MRKIVCALLFFAMIFGSFVSKGQYDPDKVCRVDNGRIIFSLNPKWTDKIKKEVGTLFDLDSALIARACKGEANISYQGESWKVNRVKNGFVELSKPIDAAAKPKSDLFMMIDQWISFSGDFAQESVTFGVNKFEIDNTFIYGKTAWFYLAGNLKADKVFISGTFNGWSTTRTPMEKVSTGWAVDLKLRPGKYSYKFIVDGHWIHDPYNNLKERDGAGGYNSVVFCPNHQFVLKGFENAKKVFLTGNFVNWKPQALAMKKVTGGWSLPIYLRDGTYTYKFVVDNQWMTDPANKMVLNDGSGNLNSYLSIGEPFVFKLDGHTDAWKVVLSGSFNGWNTGELRMERVGKGWQIPYVIPAGNYEYKFIVDGKWMTDPANPFNTGSGDYTNSFIALKANHLFVLDNHAEAKSVIVTGSFNGWNKNEYRMVREGGNWVFPLYLPPGKHTYKFIVDGRWISDPTNQLYESNGFGSYNSILWIDPEGSAPSPKNNH